MSYFSKGHHDTSDKVDDFDEYDATPYGGGYDIHLTYGRPLHHSDEICYPNTSSESLDFDYDRPQSKGHHDTSDEVDNFDEYYATPYGGGYDIHLTYGRPLHHSDEICYPNTSSESLDFDYDRPQYTSSAEPSAYAEEALDNEYKNYVRCKTSGGSKRKPAYQEPEQEYGSGYGRKSGYGETEPEYEALAEPGYGRKPAYGEPEQEYGSGYGRKPDYQEPEPEYEAPAEPECGSWYGRKPVYGEVELEYGVKRIAKAVFGLPLK